MLIVDTDVRLCVCNDMITRIRDNIERVCWLHCDTTLPVTHIPRFPPRTGARAFNRYNNITYKFSFQYLFSRLLSTFGSFSCSIFGRIAFIFALDIRLQTASSQINHGKSQRSVKHNKQRNEFRDSKLLLNI